MNNLLLQKVLALQSKINEKDALQIQVIVTISEVNQSLRDITEQLLALTNSINNTKLKLNDTYITEQAELVLQAKRLEFEAEGITSIQNWMKEPIRNSIEHTINSLRFRYSTIDDTRLILLQKREDLVNQKTLLGYTIKRFRKQLSPMIDQLKSEAEKIKSKLECVLV